MKTQTGSISFEATGGFNSYAKQNYATLSQIKGQFATSSTGKTTVNKAATIVPSNADWSLFNGATVTVKFDSANSAMNPTLNVNGSGAKPIRDYKGNELTAEAMNWKEGSAMAFTYDGTYWRLQDSNLIERMYSAETAIDQNANEIVLKASKEEAYQLAQPNLIPYFESQPINITTNTYWKFVTNLGTITEKEDGWVRFQYTNNTTTAKRAFETGISLCPSVVPGREYTWLVEYRHNASINDTNNAILDMYLVQATDNQFWGAGISKRLDDGSTSGRSDMAIGLTKNALNPIPVSGYIRRTKIAENVGSSRWSTGATEATNECARWNCNVAAGATVDIEFRISLYEGEYTGPWKPYGGPQLYASQSELKITSDEISTKVSKDGVISSINQTAESVKISADKIELDGTAVFNSLSEKGYGSTYELLVPINSANGTLTATLYKNGIICTDSVYFEGQYTTNGTAWSNWAAMTGTVTVGTKTATHTISKPGQVQTIKIVVYNTASKEKVLATYTGTLVVDSSGAIASAEQNAKDYVDNQVIGGRNLWIQRDTIDGHVNSSTGTITTTTSSHKSMQKLIEVEPGETLIEQMWNPNLVNNTTNTNRFAYFKEDKTFLSVVNALRPNGEAYQMKKYVVPADAKYVRFGAIQGSTTGYDKDIKIKIEKGTIATDYTAAPEDIEAATWTWYAECDSAASATAKVATLVPETENFFLEKGQRVGVAFSITNTAAVASLTLNVNNTGAKPIKYTVSGGDVGNLPEVGYLKANRVYDFMYDGTNWVMQYNYNSDTVNRTRWQNVVKAAGAITSGKLICGTANGYQNIAAGVSFDLTYPVLYAATTKATGETSDNNYLQINGINLANTATIQNPEQYKTVFLKGKVIGNSFTIDSTNVFTCTIPTAADDYFYMPLGMFYNSTTNIYFNSSTALWAYIDGRFRAVTPTEIVATQKIYYRSKVSGTVPKPATWITNTGNVFNDTVSKGDNGWSTKVTAIASGKGENAVKYLYLYTCEQRKRLDGTIDCTTVLLDDSTTIIDGGNIITHSITANQLDAANINASNMLTIGAFNANDQKEILNSELNIGGRNLLSGNSGKPGKWTVSAPATANYTKVESNNGYNVTVNFNAVSGGYENLNSPAITVEPNQQYTLSCDYSIGQDYTCASNRKFGISVRTDSGNHSSYDDLTSNSLGQAAFKMTTGTGHTSWTFTPTVSTIYLCLNGGHIKDGQTDLSFDVYNIKLEKGNKDTDWSPAPEDMVTTIDLDNLTIGGRNLYAYSKTKYGYYSGTNTTITNHATARHIDEKFAIAPGESVTFQQWGGYAGAGASTHQIRWLKSDGTPIKAENFGAMQQIGHVVKTVTAPAETAYFEISCVEMLYASEGDAASSWRDIKVKLEYGNKPTDYSPAPEDLIQDGINLLRDTQNPSETDTVSADHWCPQSGGNAVRSFGEITDSPVKGLNRTFRYTNNTSGNADWGQVVTFLTDEDGMDGCYTYSCWVRAINGSPRILIRLYGNDEKSAYSKAIGTAWERIVIPFFYVRTANTASSLRILMGVQSTGSLEIIAPKLERGIYATTWSPSPKDVDADIAAAHAAADEAMEAAQAAQVIADGIANPNLSPFFNRDFSDVYNATSNPTGYWKSLNTTGFTKLEDGWAHFEYENTNTSVTYPKWWTDINTILNTGILKPSTKYTFLIEIKNYSYTGTKGFLGVSTKNNTNTDVWVESLIIPAADMGNGEKRMQGTTEADMTDKVLFTYGEVQVPASSSVSFDIRVSIYESLKVEDTYYAYTGPYKPYVPLKVVTATQRIYYRSKVSGAPPAPTTWITQNGNKYNENATTGNGGWSKKITPVAESLNATKYIYLYTCEQQKYYDGTIKCTTVLLDDSQTVIDGGNIATGSVTANKLNATDINASHILTVGSFTTATENSISNDKIVIGGTNLLYNSADTTLWPLYSQNYLCAKIYMTENLIQSEAYSLRVWGNVTRSDKEAKLLAFWGGGSNPLGTMTYNNNGWWELKFTVTAAQAGHTQASNPVLFLYIGPSPVGASGTTYTSTITKAKLEKGNKHTDWTPAPEDVDSAITTAQSTANTAQTTANQAQSDIDNLSIGGRNLLRGSAKLGTSGSVHGWVYNGGVPSLDTVDGVPCIKVTSTAANAYIPSARTTSRVNLEWGQTYIASCWLMFNEDVKNVFGDSVPLHFHAGSVATTDVFDLNINSHGGGVSTSEIEPDANYGDTIPANTWVKFVRKIVTSAEAPNADYPYPVFAPFVFGSLRKSTTSTEHITWIRDFKIEKGDRATDWTPAPEDVDASLNEIIASNGNYTILWNYSAYATANDGECYICKQDSLTHSTSDVDGSVIWNGTERTIPKGMVNPNAMHPFNIPIYIVCRLTSATSTTGTNYIVSYNNGWKGGIINAGGLSNWTWVLDTDMIIGKFVATAAEGAMIDYEIYNPPLSAKHITTNTTTAASAQNTANAAAPKTSAVSRTQRIYYQSASTTKPSTPGTASSNWVTDETGAADKWTLKRMSYSSTKPYIYTCEQKQVVSGTVSYTPVLLDDTTTVIDGGKIITGSIAANQIAASAITAEKMAANAVTADKIKAGAVTADKIAVKAIAIGNLNSDAQNIINTAYNTANMATRSTQIGENSSTLTNQWYKFASASITGTNTDYTIQFNVQAAGNYGDSKRDGILRAHIRTGSSKGSFGNAQLEWLSRSTGIVLENFVLAYKATANSSVDVELWCKVTIGWHGYQFFVDYEATRTAISTSPLWTLHEQWGANSGTASITSGYTQIISTDINQAQSTATNAAKTATNYIYADTTGMYIASADPGTENKRLHLTNSDITFYDINNDQRLKINSGSGVIVGQPGKGRVQTTDTGSYFYDTNGKKRAQITADGLQLFAANGNVTGKMGNDGTAQLGLSNGSAFHVNASSLEAYYVSNGTRTKYFSVSPTGITYGTNTVASQSYVTGQGYQTATQVSNTANTIANTAANTYVTNRDKAQYGKCSTAANTADKIVACESFLSSMLIEGIRITVKFTNANTATTPTLTVGGAAKKSIYYNGKVGSTTNPIYWGANTILTFQYANGGWNLDETPSTYSVAGILNDTGSEISSSIENTLVINGTTVAVRMANAGTYSGGIKFALGDIAMKSIYVKNTVTSTTNVLLWPANTTLTLTFNQGAWYLTDRSDPANYFHFDSTNGLRISQSSPHNPTSYVQILGSGINIVSSSGNYTNVSSNGFKIYKGNKLKANFSTSISLYDDTATEITKISNGDIRMGEYASGKKVLWLYEYEDTNKSGLYINDYKTTLAKFTPAEMIIGKVAAGEKNIRIDNSYVYARTNTAVHAKFGSDIKLYNSNGDSYIDIGKDTNDVPYITIGNAGTNKHNVLIKEGGIYFRKQTAITSYFEPDQIVIGEIAAGKKNIYINNSYVYARTNTAVHAKFGADIKLYNPNGDSYLDIGKDTNDVPYLTIGNAGTNKHNVLIKEGGIYFRKQTAITSFFEPGVIVLGQNTGNIPNIYIKSNDSNNNNNGIFFRLGTETIPAYFKPGEIKISATNSLNNVLINSDGIALRYNTTNMATFTTNTITLGKTSSYHTQMTTSSFLINYSSKPLFKITSNSVNFYYKNRLFGKIYPGTAVTDEDGFYIDNGLDISKAQTGILMRPDTGMFLRTRANETTAWAQAGIHYNDLAYRYEGQIKVGDYHITVHSTGYSVYSASRFRDAIGAAASSDIRLKRNIVEIKEEAIDFIRDLKPISYRLHNDRELGISAQSIAAADRWDTNMAFTTHEGLDEWEKMEDGSPTWKVDYIRLIPPLIKTSQILLDKTDSLEEKDIEIENGLSKMVTILESALKKIETLEAKVKELESKLM